MEVEEKDQKSFLVYQVGALQTIARIHGVVSSNLRIKAPHIQLILQVGHLSPLMPFLLNYLGSLLNKLRLETQAGDNIYVERISRLSRSVDDLHLIVQEFKDKDITVHFIKEGFNTGNNNNMFKFMLTILGTVAEMERKLTVERIREGMVKAKRYNTRSGRPAAAGNPGQL